MQYYYAMVAIAGAISKHNTAVIFLNEEDVVVDYSVNPVGMVEVQNSCNKK